jgi:hypothetical protein
MENFLWPSYKVTNAESHAVHKRVPNRHVTMRTKFLTAKYNKETPAQSCDSIDALFRGICKDSKVFDGCIEEMV